MDKKNIKIYSIIAFILFIVSIAAQNERPIRLKRQFANDVLSQQTQTAKDKDNKPSQKKINKFLYIHLIPHSHDDVGWLKTVDEYFFGGVAGDEQTLQALQSAGTQYIIDSVIDELSKDESRKFIQVETAFLYRWWISNPKKRRDLMKKLVNNGQFEFVNGGWSMHDEATTYYEDIIDQMTIGHLWLKQQFGEKGIPTTGWHIDPFGHQSTNAALFSQMGFNGWWFGRIDYQDKQKRLKHKSLEMIWKPYQASGEENSIFSACTYSGYGAPKNFNFDTFSQDDPIMDNPNLQGYNLKQKSDEFVKYFRNMSKKYKSNHLMHTMGEDFAYGNALVWYKNIDKLMTYINENPDKYNVKILYSTPSTYLSNIHNQEISWPTKEDDFFPYADQDNSYWTGYFTSRVALKGNVRDTGRYLQHIRNIFSVIKINQSSKFLQDNYQSFLSNLDSLEQNMGIMQHHDAVTGTEKQRVANDYVIRLQNSTDAINNVLHSMVEELTERDIKENVQLSQCRWNSTASECSTTFKNLKAGKTVLLNVYNPTVQRTLVIKIKVPNVSFSIIDQNNAIIYGEIFCINNTDRNDCVLYFEDEFDGYSYKYYKLVAGNRKGEVSNIQRKNIQNKKSAQVINVSDQISLTVHKDSTNYTLKDCQKSKGKEQIKENQDCTQNEFEILYSHYPSYKGAEQNSGAYIFRPKDEYKDGPEIYSEVKHQYAYNGKIVTIIFIHGTQIDTQIKIYANDYYKNVVELETFVQSIPISDMIGKEVVLIVNTPLQNNQTFYTDSNGLELQKRILNYRPTWDLKVTQPASGNYYPFNGLFTIKDVNSKKRVSLVNDRCQGATSLQDGQLEVMIHRRLLMDDNRGVMESLNEKDTDNKSGLTQKLRHFIVFEEEDTTLSRRFQNHVDTFPIIFYAKSQSNKFNDDVNIPDNYNPLKTNTDPFLKIYYRPFDENYLLRLNNLNDINTSTYALPQGIQIVEEVTLTANQSKEKWQKQKYSWKTQSQDKLTKSDSNQDQKDLDKTQIKVKPLELRAFIVSYSNIEEIPKQEIKQQKQ